MQYSHQQEYRYIQFWLLFIIIGMIINMNNQSSWYWEIVVADSNGNGITII